jgi:hypothetical protein
MATKIHQRIVSGHQFRCLAGVLMVG